MSDLEIDDINPIGDSRSGLSSSERRWLQIEKAQHNDDSIYFDGECMGAEMNTWIYPLHFIDFETTIV